MLTCPSCVETSHALARRLRFALRAQTGLEVRVLSQDEPANRQVWIGPIDGTSSLAKLPVACDHDLDAAIDVAASRVGVTPIKTPQRHIFFRQLVTRTRNTGDLIALLARRLEEADQGGLLGSDGAASVAGLVSSANLSYDDAISMAYRLGEAYAAFKSAAMKWAAATHARQAPHDIARELTRALAEVLRYEQTFVSSPGAQAVMGKDGMDWLAPAYADVPARNDKFANLHPVCRWVQPVCPGIAVRVAIDGDILVLRSI
ncbi:MAG: hypothetical protein KatS3mg051_2117 [Anaerolineae bacterium]|nr:MAG: hypothetical protein KatS3mg051_2117 [Anaerolineae bacterium]